MTDDVFKLDEDGNFLFISANGKEVTGKFDSYHKGDLNWIVNVLNGLTIENDVIRRKNEQLKQELYQQEVSEQRRKEYDEFWKEKINKGLVK